MALNDNATVVIGAGNYYMAPTGTALPENLLAPTSPWENIGHTSLEEVFGITSEGGEATVLGTLQKKSLRTRYSARSETLTFTLQQFDEASLRLYFGANAETLANGLLGVPQDPDPTECAFLAVFVDGENHFAFYAPKAEIFRQDDMSISDTESLAGMPIGVKPLVYDTNSWTYAVTPLGGIEATGVVAGAPGEFTPAGATAPANLEDLQSSGITPSPADARAPGQYVLLGDGSEAYWDGEGWVAGIAGDDSSS